MSQRMRVTASVLRMHPTPDAESPVTARLPQGSTVEVLEAGAWKFVRTPAGTGWVHGDYLTDAPAAPPKRAWRVAESLNKLKAQVDQKAPKRSRTFDGDIGDAAHAARDSEHNPSKPPPSAADQTPVVRARDITHDPEDGCDAQKIVDAIVASRDKRVLYVIFNRVIWRSYDRKATDTRPFLKAWTPERYTGPNPHDHHFHTSVVADPSLYDDTSPWSI